jgi:hypothetical protein
LQDIMDHHAWMEMSVVHSCVWIGMPPILNHTPKPLRVAAMKEKVRCRFLSFLAKRAKATIFPASPLKAVRRPNPILDCQPREELNLWGWPKLSKPFC